MAACAPSRRAFFFQRFKVSKNIYAYNNKNIRKLQKSKKRGQKRLTQEQADEEARQSLSATTVGDKKKIPGSFHLKLY